MKNRRQSVINSQQQTALKPWLPAFALVLSLAALFVFGGCKSKSKTAEGNFPLPPEAESGIYDGQFIQTDYGFGFPLPPKWLYLRLSAEQEVDEVARFSDAERKMIARVTVQLLGPAQSFDKKGWGDMAEQDLKNHQFKIQKREGAEEWKTDDSGPWAEVPFHVMDSHGGEWADEEWALSKGDLLIGVHALVPEDDAGTAEGKKFLKSLEGALTQIRWYTPIGPRGVSIERFELQHFTEGFCRALESRSTAKVDVYLDDMYPDRTKLNTWYQQAVSGDPKSFDLKAELSGLVINGDYATALFTLTRENKDSHDQKFEKDFKLSKKEGSWKIMASMDKS